MLYIVLHYSFCLLQKPQWKAFAKQLLLRVESWDLAMRLELPGTFEVKAATLQHNFKVGILDN